MDFGRVLGEHQEASFFRTILNKHELQNPPKSHPEIYLEIHPGIHQGIHSILAP